jgi:hypothetical protein
VIYVNRNADLVPPELLARAIEAQHELEAMPEDKRADFIRRNSGIWRDFKKYLSRMSYGKCWYSESPGVQTFFDVDHFRPKLEARRSETQCDRGYDWLAFSWENFRLAAQRANRRSTNEETGETEGKGSWFPLLEGSPRASWEQRCVEEELPVLLDPTLRPDVDLIDVNAAGFACPSRYCIGSARVRVERSIQIYGLNLPDLTAARKRVMREIIAVYDALERVMKAGAEPAVADRLPVAGLIDELRQKTLPSRPYSKAARAQLILSGGAHLCAQPEDIPARREIFGRPADG